MATWTENQTVTWTDASPPDGVTSTANIDIATDNYRLINLQVSITWHGSATDYADLFFYGSADSGSTIDTKEYYNLRVDADAGNTTILSVVLENLPYVRVAFENQSNQEVAALTAIYAGLL